MMMPLDPRAIDPTLVHRTIAADTPLFPPTSTFPQGSSEWWIQRLLWRLESRRRDIEELDAYYRGKTITTLWFPSTVPTALQTLMRRANVNLAKLIVEAPRQRLVIYGFRLDNKGSDQEAWRIWQANQMDAGSAIAHRAAMIKRECPVLVEPNPRDPRTPIITVQDPLDAIVETAAGDRRIRRAALKRWVDDTGRMLITLYLPDRVEKWQERNPGELVRRSGSLYGDPPPTVEHRPGGQWQMANPLGEVSMVALPNQPREDGTCEAEHEAALPLIDVYNKTVRDMLKVSDMLAFPQRWGTGVEDKEERPLVDPVTGDALLAAPPAVRATPEDMITTPAPDATFGTFQAATLDGHIRELEEIRGDIAAISFLPYDAVLNVPGSVPQTGEAIKAGERWLVAKVQDHQRDKGEAWEEVMRLAFKAAGDEQRASVLDAETIWKDAETRSEAAHTDALMKLQSIGLPMEVILEMLPTSPRQAARYLELTKAAWGDEMSPDDMASLIEQVKAGLRTEAEARAVMKLSPIAWPEALSKEESDTLISQVQADILTVDEARAMMKLPPMDFSQDPHPEDITSLIDQVKADLITIDEARAKLGLPPMQFSQEPHPEDIASLIEQVKGGLLDTDEARARLGLPPAGWPEDISEKTTQASDLIKAGFDPEDVLAKLGLPPITHIGLPPITVQKPADAAGLVTPPPPPPPTPPGGAP